jgi:hypothetical protein
LPASAVTQIDVTCAPEADGWKCEIGLRGGSLEIHHHVTVSGADLERLQPGATDPADLVRRSFEFLLEREPPESILRSFDLTVIGRYFPDYERAIRPRPD